MAWEQKLLELCTLLINDKCWRSTLSTLFPRWSRWVGPSGSLCRLVRTGCALMPSATDLADVTKSTTTKGPTTLPIIPRMAELGRVGIVVQSGRSEWFLGLERTGCRWGKVWDQCVEVVSSWTNPLGLWLPHLYKGCIVLLPCSSREFFSCLDD